MQIEPRVVICTRGNLRTEPTYDAEISLGYETESIIGQKLISAGHKSREEAKAAAQPIVDNLISEIHQLCKKHLSQYKDARP
jgi:hypothetical protein